MKLFTLNIKDLEFSELERLAKKYPKRFFKAKSYLNPDDYYRSMGVYLLLEKAFGDFKENDIKLTPTGKPFMEGKDFFSYSHSGDYVVLCTSNISEVGIDIEKIESKRIRIDEKLFSKKEIEFINKNPIVNFFMIWTKKESLLKLTGEGLKTLTLLNIELLNDTFTYNNKSVFQTTELFDDHIVTISSYSDEVIK